MGLLWLHEFPDTWFARRLCRPPHETSEMLWWKLSILEKHLCKDNEAIFTVYWYFEPLKPSLHLRKICKRMFGAWPAQYVPINQHPSSSDWQLALDIELIVGYPPFDNLMPNRDDLIREWVSMLGDLPQEWGEYLPPTQANGTQFWRCALLSLSLSLMIGLLDN